jgi:hypothetical protein
MQNLLSLPPFRPSETEARPTFDVVIAYEDFETGKHGKRTYDFLVDHLGDDFVFSSQMWKFDVLSVPKLREMAAKDASAADIIIVSCHGHGPLPREVKAWVELWMKEKLHATALVALFDKNEYLDNPSRSYLAEVASRANLEFFSQPGAWPGHEEELTTAGGLDRNTKAFSVLAGIEKQDRDISHWGINE